MFAVNKTGLKGAYRIVKILVILTCDSPPFAPALFCSHQLKPGRIFYLLDCASKISEMFD